MNAKELLSKIENDPASHTGWTAAEWRVVLRALRLLAAAEGGEGTPESDAIRELCYEASYPREVWEASHIKIERQRNALAARVRELEKDASVSGGVAPVSAEVKTAAGGSPAPNINEAMLLLAEVEPHLDEWNFPITLQDRVTAACNAYFGEVRPFLDAARSK